jgi:hypothetical protein
MDDLRNKILGCLSDTVLDISTVDSDVLLNIFYDILFDDKIQSGTVVTFVKLYTKQITFALNYTTPISLLAQKHILLIHTDTNGAEKLAEAIVHECVDSQFERELVAFLTNNMHRVAMRLTLQSIVDAMVQKPNRKYITQDAWFQLITLYTENTKEWDPTTQQNVEQILLGYIETNNKNACRLFKLFANNLQTPTKKVTRSLLIGTEIKQELTYLSRVARGTDTPFHCLELLATKKTLQELGIHPIKIDACASVNEQIATLQCIGCVFKHYPLAREYVTDIVCSMKGEYPFKPYEPLILAACRAAKDIFVQIHNDNALVDSIMRQFIRLLNIFNISYDVIENLSELVAQYNFGPYYVEMAQVVIANLNDIHIYDKMSTFLIQLMSRASPRKSKEIAELALPVLINELPLSSTVLLRTIDYLGAMGLHDAMNIYNAAIQTSDDVKYRLIASLASKSPIDIQCLKSTDMDQYIVNGLNMPRKLNDRSRYLECLVDLVSGSVSSSLIMLRFDEIFNALLSHIEQSTDHSYTRDCYIVVCMMIDTFPYYKIKPYIERILARRETEYAVNEFQLVVCFLCTADYGAIMNYYTRELFRKDVFTVACKGEYKRKVLDRIGNCFCRLVSIDAPLVTWSTFEQFIGDNYRASGCSDELLQAFGTAFVKLRIFSGKKIISRSIKAMKRAAMGKTLHQSHLHKRFTDLTFN